MTSYKEKESAIRATDDTRLELLSRQLLQIILHRAVRERELLKAHDRRSVLGSKTKNSDDVAGFESVFVPAAHAHQHGRTPHFTGPFFDFAFVVLYIHGNQRVWIDELEVRHGPFNGHDLVRIVIRFSVMCQERGRNQKRGEGYGQNEREFLHFPSLPKNASQDEITFAETIGVGRKIYSKYPIEYGACQYHSRRPPISCI